MASLSRGKCYSKLVCSMPRQNGQAGVHSAHIYPATILSLFPIEELGLQLLSSFPLISVIVPHHGIPFKASGLAFLNLFAGSASFAFPIEVLQEPHVNSGTSRLDWSRFLPSRHRLPPRMSTSHQVLSQNLLPAKQPIRRSLLYLSDLRPLQTLQTRSRLLHHQLPYPHLSRNPSPLKLRRHQSKFLSHFPHRPQQLPLSPLVSVTP
ncbi:hypothetical protein C8Q74DRAFT_301348 [Fomes fomentarius]|nr:hypothetical protein C8Q74DRAFT_301348 [Fomes fomentarius]